MEWGEYNHKSLMRRLYYLIRCYLATALALSGDSLRLSRC
jgi:hypothetical protein